MCLTCGCMLPHEDHGKADYLTIEDLEKSARVDGYDPIKRSKISSRRSPRPSRKRLTTTNSR